MYGLNHWMEGPTAVQHCSDQSLSRWSGSDYMAWCNSNTASGRLGHVIYQPWLVYTSHGLVYHKWYIPILWYTMVYHTQNVPYHMCDIPPVICNCDITEHVWYIPCDITSMVYTILWYTIKCDIPWYIGTIYTIPCMLYSMLYGYDIYHAIYHPNISWYIPCDIPHMWYHTCDIPYMWYTMVYGYGIYHTTYGIWHIIYHDIYHDI